jgi:D-arabinose 1-dehydrogenase-like Zn-dependent alcohol dehydrogenase
MSEEKNLCATVAAVNQPFSFEDRAVPTPGVDEVVIQVHACGLCHSDCLTVMGEC